METIKIFLKGVFGKIKKNFLIKMGKFVVNCNFICYNEKNNCDKERICLIG